jgi:hypothetical protein
MHLAKLKRDIGQNCDYDKVYRHDEDVKAAPCGKYWGLVTHYGFAFIGVRESILANMR